MPLTDGEIVALRNHRGYKKLTRVGLKKIVTDLVRNGADELRPEASFLLTLAPKFIRARVIRSELHVTTNTLVERFLNLELVSDRTTNSVKGICDREGGGFVWMRYDVPRVEAVFTRARVLLADAGVRELIKIHSSLALEEKNRHLSDLLEELDVLRYLTVQSIKTRGIVDTMSEIAAEAYYRENGERLQEKFLASGRAGSLGIPGISGSLLSDEREETDPPPPEQQGKSPPTGI